MSYIECENCGYPNHSYRDECRECDCPLDYDPWEDERLGDMEVRPEQKYFEKQPEIINYTITPNTASFVSDGEVYTFPSNHGSYPFVCKALIDNNQSELDIEIAKMKVNLSFMDGKIYSRHGVLYVATQDEMCNTVEYGVDDRLYDRIYRCLDNGENIQSMIRFIDNLYQNPNAHSIDDMYRFLQHNNLPLTEDGCFLAYKKVRDNYKDIHSGSFDNSVGRICSMQREDVEFNREVTCSSGLHFCSKDYLSSFGDSTSRVVVLKINPKNVVSIPTDYNNAKGRACEYEVIGELPVDRVDDAIRELESSSIITKIGNFFKSLLGV